MLSWMEDVSVLEIVALGEKKGPTEHRMRRNQSELSWLDSIKGPGGFLKKA